MSQGPFHNGDLPECQNLRGKNVLVMGLGSFGGGLGATRFLASQGALVTVTDTKTETQLRPSLARLQGLPIEYHFGGHEGVDFTSYDLIVVNPAVPKTSPYLAQAEAAGVYLTSEMNLFMARCKGKTIGITGSNGKTTTTALTAHLLKASDRKTWVGGNIGMSLLERVHEIGEKDAVVLELSSFQLDDLHRIQISPTVGVMLNLTPNHLDRHGNMEAYAAAKMAVFAWQKQKDIAILNYDDVRVARLQSEVPSRLAMFSVGRKVSPGGYIWRSDFTVDLGGGPKTVCPTRELQLPGRHNRSNALAAICASMVMRAKPGGMAQLLRTFKGVEHRLEIVGERSGVRFYNDSVSTTPESTIASLSAFKSQDTWVILGGGDKGHDWERMADHIADQNRCVGAICIGETGPEIAAALRDAAANNGRQVHVIEAQNLGDAMDELRRVARANQVVLLSPATSSYDQYRNFEERGRHFKELVVRWQRAAGAVAPRGRRLTPESVRVTGATGATRGGWKQVVPAEPPMFPGSRPGVPQPSAPPREAPRQTETAPAQRPRTAAQPPAAQAQAPSGAQSVFPPAQAAPPIADPNAPPPIGWPQQSQQVPQAQPAPAQSNPWSGYPGADPFAGPDAAGDTVNEWQQQPGFNSDLPMAHGTEDDWSADPWGGGSATQEIPRGGFPGADDRMDDTWMDPTGSASAPTMPAANPAAAQPAPAAPGGYPSAAGLPAEVSQTWTENNPLPANFEDPFAAYPGAGAPPFQDDEDTVVDESGMKIGGGGGADLSVFGPAGSVPLEFPPGPSPALAQPAGGTEWADASAEPMAAPAWSGESEGDESAWAEPGDIWNESDDSAGGAEMAPAEEIFGSEMEMQPFDGSAVPDPSGETAASIDPNIFATNTGGSRSVFDATNTGGALPTDASGTMPDTPLSLFAEHSGSGDSATSDTMMDGPPSLFQDNLKLVDPMDTQSGVPRFTDDGSQIDPFAED